MEKITQYLIQSTVHGSECTLQIYTPHFYVI